VGVIDKRRSGVALVSFDIDGTLECGQPPGVVPVALVRTAQRLGYLVGSCSDRPITYQQTLWDALGIAVDFMVLKHRLGELKTRFGAAAYYHIGDAEADARYASVAGFRFLKAEAAAHAAWATELFGTSA
jgi:hypothetical protein